MSDAPNRNQRSVGIYLIPTRKRESSGDKSDTRGQGVELQECIDKRKESQVPSGMATTTEEDTTVGLQGVDSPRVDVPGVGKRIPMAAKNSEETS